MTKNKNYSSPGCEVIEAVIDEIICQSMEIEVGDPFSGNQEVEW